MITSKSASILGDVLAYFQLLIDPRPKPLPEMSLIQVGCAIDVWLVCKNVRAPSVVVVRGVMDERMVKFS